MRGILSWWACSHEGVSGRRLFRIIVNVVGWASADVVGDLFSIRVLIGGHRNGVSLSRHRIFYEAFAFVPSASVEPSLCENSGCLCVLDYPHADRCAWCRRPTLPLPHFVFTRLGTMVHGPKASDEPQSKNAEDADAEPAIKWPVVGSRRLRFAVRLHRGSITK
jgi:hypothetical protein